MPRRSPPTALYRDVTRAAWLGLAVNAALGIVKLVGGLLSGSLALISDALNSWADVFVSVMPLFALRMAQRPPDKEHPYGHTRAEAIAASNLAIVIILSALGIAWEAIRHLADGHAVPPAWTLWIAAGNVVNQRVALSVQASRGATHRFAGDHRQRLGPSQRRALFAGRAGRPGPVSLRRTGVSSGPMTSPALVVVGAIIWSGVTAVPHQRQRTDGRAGCAGTVGRDPPRGCRGARSTRRGDAVGPQVRAGVLCRHPYRSRPATPPWLTVMR